VSFLTTIQYNWQLIRQKNFGNYANTWKLSNSHVNSQWVKKETNQEITNCIEANGNGHCTSKPMGFSRSNAKREACNN
jgi:hypothetical protein